MEKKIVIHLADDEHDYIHNDRYVKLEYDYEIDREELLDFISAFISQEKFISVQVVEVE